MIGWLLLVGLVRAGTVDVSPRVVASESGGEVMLVGGSLSPDTRVVMVQHQAAGPTEHGQVVAVGEDGALRFAVPAWQVPGRYELRIESPGGPPRCVAGGIEIVARPCEVLPAEVAKDGGLTAAGQRSLAAGGRCLAAQGATAVVAFGLSGPGEGLGLLREDRADGRTLALGYRPDLAVARAQEGARHLAGLMPARQPVLAVGLARPLPPRQAHEEGAWEEGPRVELVGAWASGLGPAGCPVSEGVPDDATIRCLVEAEPRAVVVAAPDRVRRLDESAGFDVEDLDLTEALDRLRAARLPVLMGARPDGTEGLLIVPVAKGGVGPPRHFPVEGCAGSLPLARRYGYGRGDEPTWSWAVLAGSGLSTDPGGDGSLGPVAGGLARVGLTRGPFLGVDVDLPLTDRPRVSVAPAAGLEIGLGRERVPAALWASGRGLTTGAPGLGFGADLPAFAGFARRLVLALGPRAAVALDPDGTWSLGFVARLGWRQEHPWGRDAR